MQEIIERHPVVEGSIYLLPVIQPGTDERRQYKNASARINKHLRKIGEMVGLSTPLTMYVSRHSWASAAKEKKIPLSVISEGLGHDSELTTRIYLASLDTAEIDRANSLILRALQKDNP
jgi:integrase